VLLWHAIAVSTTNTVFSKLLHDVKHALIVQNFNTIDKYDEAE